MTLSVTFNSQVLVSETFTGGYVNPSANTITLNGLSETITLNGGTTPAVTVQSEFQQALTAGAATIDLTTLPGLTSQETVNGNGLTVQFLKLRNLATNANSITIVKGASNGYALLGSAMSITLAPGQSLTLNGNAATPAISSTAKTLDLTGTGSQILEVVVVMG
jgi:hypothetical protein